MKVFLVESGGTDRVTQHVNVGYTFSKDSGGSVPAAQIGAAPTFPDEFNYAAGVEFVVEPRVTIIGDIVGRNLRSAGRLDLVSKTFQFQPPGNPAPPIASMQFDEFEPRSGNLNLLYGTAGVKFNPKGNILFSASVLFPLDRLRPQEPADDDRGNGLRLLTGCRVGRLSGCQVVGCQVVRLSGSVWLSVDGLSGQPDNPTT